MYDIPNLSDHIIFPINNNVINTSYYFIRTQMQYQKIDSILKLNFITSTLNYNTAISSQQVDFVPPQIVN